jgi:ribosomal protein S18 acetylase RimI-like enzyme
MKAGHFAIRRAEIGDALAVGTLLHRFNEEFGAPTPGVEALSRRMLGLLGNADTVVLLGGDGPDGLVVLRFREAIWSDGLECYLAELYVVPDCRGNGLGRTLVEVALDEARERGADYIELGTGENDLAARSLYESLGFSNRDGDAGPVNYHYGRDL